MKITEHITLPMSFKEEYKNAGVEPGEDLEARIERLEFRNKKLHQYVDKIIDENLRLRKNNEDLVKQVTEQFRNKGVI